MKVGRLSWEPGQGNTVVHAASMHSYGAAWLLPGLFREIVTNCMTKPAGRPLPEGSRGHLLIEPGVDPNSGGTWMRVPAEGAMPAEGGNPSYHVNACDK